MCRATERPRERALTAKSQIALPGPRAFRVWGFSSSVSATSTTSCHCWS